MLANSVTSPAVVPTGTQPPVPVAERSTSYAVAPVTASQFTRIAPVDTVVTRTPTGIPGNVVADAPAA